MDLPPEFAMTAFFKLTLIALLAALTFVVIDPDPETHATSQVTRSVPDR